MNLVVKNLSKIYSQDVGVKNVSFSLGTGVYGLLGVNGAGKTTLMKMLTTLLVPSAGSIEYNGENIFDNLRKYRKTLGYLPQDFGYYPEFSAEDYLIHIAILKGMTKIESKSKSSSLLKSVGLYDDRKKKLKVYSGGMVRRIGIAQALLNDPSVLILDEPTAGLDPKERIRFRNLIAKIAENRIVLLSTHIVSDIEMIAKKMILLQNGEITKNGTIESCLKEISGKVWSMEGTREELRGIAHNCFVCSAKENGNKMYIRILSDNVPNLNATTVEPTLEDLFAYYSGKEEEADAIM